MVPVLERIKKGEIILADGAMGSMLFQRGLKPGDCPEQLNLTNPEIPEEVARLYFEAGAEIVQTNTFGGSPAKLAEYGLDERAEEINARAVACVRRAVGQKAYVSGSCGPSGQLLQPFGTADRDEIFQGFKRQSGALIRAGVDLVCVETMIDIEEAVLAVRAVRENSERITVMATMTFDATANGFYTMMGVTIEQAAGRLQEAGADIVGSNCGNGIDNMIKIAAEFRANTDLPILIQANAGLPEIKEGQSVYPESPEYFASKIDALRQAGVSIIGGCCGTTPQHIRAMRREMDNW